MGQSLFITAILLINQLKLLVFMITVDKVSQYMMTYYAAPPCIVASAITKLMSGATVFKYLPAGITGVSKISQ